MWPFLPDIRFYSCFQPFPSINIEFLIIIFHIQALISHFICIICSYLTVSLNFHSWFQLFQEIFYILQTFSRINSNLHWFALFYQLFHITFELRELVAECRKGYWSWFQIKDFMATILQYLTTSLLFGGMILFNSFSY